MDYFSSGIGFLILLASLLVATATKTSSVYNHNNHNLSTDRASLVAFKSYVTSDPRKILKNGWSDSTFVCNWTGVTCGGDPSVRVVGLDLSTADLTGAVPPHLGNLSSLVELRFRSNSFGGVLPRELSRLKQLEVFSFGFNKLSGVIPAWLGSLPKLRTLGLYGNRFSGSVPTSIFNATSLVALDLSANGLSGTLPDNLCLHLPNIEELYFVKAHLSGQIPSRLSECKKLRLLSLTSNEFQGNVPKTIANLTRAKYIYLGDNKLTGEIQSWVGFPPQLRQLGLYGNLLSGSIPAAVFNTTFLEALDVSRNKFSGSIPTAISNATLLKILQLHTNHLSGNVPEEIGSLNYLETLQLHTNGMKGPFPKFVFNMSSLKNLALSLNSFPGTLPHNLCQYLPNIERIFLVQNNLTGQIPSEFSECKQLSVLVLARNNFFGGIPKSIGILSRAIEIDLGTNKLKGSIPKEIGNLQNLEILDLGFNNITGVVPPAIFNITTLKEISINFNKISGTLPSDLGLWLPNLEKLYMSGNDLTGKLPESISNASQLTILEIGGNHLSGFIPNSLTSLKSLQIISLFDNNFKILEETDNILSKFATLSQLTEFGVSQNPLDVELPSSIGMNISMSLSRLLLDDCDLRGDIPASIANFSGIIELNLAGNRLSGSVPPAIGKLQKLQGLYLSENLLDGHIPFELCQLRYLYGLYLRNNMLSGSIPRCLGHTTSLRNLDLASNKFSSIIPSTFWDIKDILNVDLSSNSLIGSLSAEIGKLKGLISFSVSSNQLSGNISSSIGDLQSLEYLDLGSNNFQGSIPDSMSNSLSLKYLDLSNNSLSGVIPKSMEKLSYLTFLNLSYNKLYGEIPSGGPFSNFSGQSFIHNQNLCGELRLRVPQCKSAPKKPNKASILRYVIPSVIIGAILFTMSLIVIAFCRKKSRKLDLEATMVTLRRVSPFELSKATDGFKDENLLGVGGFGSVFKGTLSDGLVVAIKVFNSQLEQAFESFASECQVLCNIRHKNLVKIITCCSTPDFKALVLQYMPHGSLDKWLYSDGAFLTLLQRLTIMIDVASALEYLHYGHSTPIVHCDVKPSNVLLDENMVGHVSDFGLSRVLRGDNSLTQTMTLATIGYMAPEYGVGCVVSRRGDIYSFGIMLMEVFTKKKPTDDMFTEEMNLRQWVQNSIQNEAIDSDLLRPEDSDYLDNKECVTSILELALSCSASLPEERMDIKTAISELNKFKNKFITNV